MMRKLQLIVTTIVASAVLGGTVGQAAQADQSAQQIVQRAVCHYFKGKLCTTAMRIVNCETGGSYNTPWATNGQHHGIFQMGSQERATYGDGNNIWAQAKAAYAYYSVAGFGPWLNYEPPGCGY